MKFYLFIILSAIFLFTACSSKEETVTTVAADGTIIETPLPKGKFIIDDETALTNIPLDPTTFNGIKGQDTVAKTNPSKEQQEDAMLKRRYKGLLVFHVNDTMKIKKAYIAKLILGKEQVLNTLTEEVLEGTRSKKDEVLKDTGFEIGSKMKAVLTSLNETDGKGFEIEALGSETQSISPKRKKAIWSWKITPLTEGEEHLVLSVNIIEKDDEPVNLPPKDFSVLIFAKPESTLSKVTSFFEKNYQWLLATLLIPLFMGWYNARMRHRFDKKIFAERDKTNAAGFNQHPAAPLQHTAQNTEAPKETGNAATNTGTSNTAN